jgi:enamine deaminase RidA (YjgF/YER057c/UK114 family)
MAMIQAFPAEVQRAGQALKSNRMSAGERQELMRLGMLSPEGEVAPAPMIEPPSHMGRVARSAISEPAVLNEAYEYTTPSSFSRGLRVELGDSVLFFISGTASVDENGATVHVGDFRAQCWRTYRNITELLASEGASWRDVVKCTCYLRDIERDYKDFNQVRTAFFNWLELNPLPASVGIQARLCREDLLVEIECLAVWSKRR